MTRKTKSRWHFGELSLKRASTSLLISSLLIIAACDRETPNNVASSTNVVVFREANVSVDVGSGWKRIYFSQNPSDCTPTLSSSNGIVGAMLFSARDTTVQEAITAEHQLFEKHTNSVKDSWHQVGFTSGSGLTGQRMSYIETKTNDGKQTLRQLHNFVFQRKDGRLVSVSFMGPAGDKADAVEQMMERTLKLQ